MHQQTKECTSFETDENVYRGLSVQDENTNKNVLNCLYKLYANDCIKWLIKTTGGQSGGEAVTHNAHQAFNDSLLAILDSVKKKRFAPDGRPNSARRFVYFVSQRYYFKLRGNKNINTQMIPEDDPSIYPRPDFEFPMESDEKIRKLHETIKTMPVECREVLGLRYIDVESTEDIANKMGLTKKQVIKKLYDCREKFRQFIPDDFNEKY
jgi:RNA polymerase sigma factor (sigma-70 family)